MSWYKKLNDYFPEQEMKKREHLSDLLDDQDVYHKEETENYIILYAEFENYLFIDYLLVTSKSRGKGLGTKVLNKFKDKGKMIILETEPPDIEDLDTERRLAFYLRNGFVKADHIQYERKDAAGELFAMNVLYWTPANVDVTEKNVMTRMAEACSEIHNYKSKQYYGREVADPDKVLQWKK